MTYAVEFSSDARKSFNRLDRVTKRRIAEEISRLASSPFDLRLSKQLKGEELAGLRSARVGGWRVCFTVGRAAAVLYVLSIERRGQVYKRL